MPKALTSRPEFRRCGKATCRSCASGPSHGPYWYAYWRDAGGRLRKQYCGRDRDVVGLWERGDEPLWAPRLRVQLLGGFQLDLGTRRAVITRELSGHARRLLALLLLHPSGIHREQVIDGLFAEQEYGAARRAVRSAAGELRTFLHPDAEANPERWRLETREEMLSLRLVDGDVVDIHTFESLSASDDIGDLTEALDLYHGELLPEYLYDDWALPARERLRLRWRDASISLARKLSATGAHGRAAEVLRGVLRDDPTDESAARLLMTALGHAGNATELRAVYASLRDALSADVGSEPEPSTRTAYQAALLLSGPAPLTIDPVTASTSETPSRLSAQDAIHHLLEIARRGLDARCTLSSRSLVPSDRVADTSDDQRDQVGSELLSANDRELAEGQPAETLASATRLAGTAADCGAADVLAVALRRGSKAAQLLGYIPEASELAHHATALSLTVGDPDEVLRSRRLMAHVLWSQARFADATQVHRQNLLAARSSGNSEHIGYVLCGLGGSLWPQGKLEEADSVLGEAISLSQRIGDSFLELSATYHRANCLYELSHVRRPVSVSEAISARGEALHAFQRSIDLATAEGNELMGMYSLVDYAVALCEWDEARQAGDVLATLEDMGSRIGDNRGAVAWLLTARATLLLKQGQLNEALSTALAAIADMTGHSPSGLALAHRVAGLAEHGLGNTTGATNRLSFSLTAAATNGQVLEAARTREAMAI